MEILNTGNNGNNNQGLKRTLIKYVGGNNPPEEVFIGPGTTTADLLQELKLDPTKWSASKGPADTIYGLDEILFPSLEDGGLIYVSSEVNAGE